MPIARASEPGQAGAVGRRDAAQAFAGTIGNLGETGWLQPVRSAWSWPAIAALVIPALILLLVWLA